jgi:tRNA-(ms[2]io[6]A)-hydroxylase
MKHSDLLEPIKQFLLCDTPEAWLKLAADNIELLLIDHAHCEKKAASTGLSLIYRYPDKPELLKMLSQLVREEMLHFEQVLELIENRGFNFTHMSASNYASSLHEQASKQEPQRLIDSLIIGAIIEARSCERFFALSTYVDEELAQYYQFLLKSESRHFENYLHLARLYDEGGTESRIQMFLEIEKEFILSEDEPYRFHSGIPA